MVRAELERLRKSGGKLLRLPRGEHHFWPEAGLVRSLYISNNDSGENRIVFPIDGYDGLTIDGQGARLVFHGLATPFALLGSKNITLRNVEIDWQVPFHVEADVLAADPEGTWIEVSVPAEFSYRLDDQGQFYFKGEGFERQGIGNILAFDRVKHETVYQVADNFFLTRDGTYSRTYTITETAPRRLRIEVPKKFRTTPAPGNRIVLQPRPRQAPAVLIADSETVRLEKVLIRHSGCMGVVAQLSRDISLTDCEVRPRPGGGRYVSTPFDATHFVNCSGMVSLERCKLSNHIDDGLNVHGIFLRGLGGERATLRAELFDRQQRGIQVLAAGDEITIADSVTLETWYTGRVLRAAYPDDRYINVEVEPELPRSLREGDVINNLSRNPDVVFRDCSVGWNRARGLLLSTAGKTLVENSRFHTPGSAIRVSSGVDFWYEAGPSTDVVIRNNIFDNCRYGIWGDAVIEVMAVDGKDSASTAPYHGRVAITGNRFDTFDGLLVHAYRAAELDFTGNQIVASKAYPRFRTVKSPVEVKAVGKVNVANNQVTGFAFDAMSRPADHK